MKYKGINFYHLNDLEPSPTGKNNVDITIIATMPEVKPKDSMHKLASEEA